MILLEQLDKTELFEIQKLERLFQLETPWCLVELNFQERKYINNSSGDFNSQI